jgi:multicomponent Na+:H+ antiporter subunit D
MNNLIALPIAIPLASAIILLIFRSQRIQRVVNLIGAAVFFAATVLILHTVYTSGIQVLRFGSWPAPFAITFAVDMLSALLVTVTGFVAFNIAIFSLADIGTERVKFGFYPLLNVLLMGVCGAFMTGDLFNLYVWFEVMLMASFVLMALGGERAQIEGAVKYLTLNFVASLMFLIAIGVIYGKTGTLNMADLAYRLANAESIGLEQTATALFLIAFGIKAGVFPLYFWLPASYHTPPATVSAIFAGLLTKVGVYALIRIITLVFHEQMPQLQTILYIIAGMTMVSGVLGAATQFDFRRILSFHIISQIGYMILGLALFTPLALAAAVFYIFHHIIVKTNLFLISGIASHLQGSYQLKQIGGLYKAFPFLAFLFLVPALSLGGIPPLSGFFAKFVVIKAGILSQEYILVAVALAVGILTIYSMTKIWAEVFWSPQPENSGKGIQKIPPAMLTPVIIMALATVCIGIFAENLMEMSQIAAQQLADPKMYIEAILWSQK